MRKKPTLKHATICWGLHEKKTIIPKYKNEMFSLKRYINENVIIGNDNGNAYEKIITLISI